jgi:hypothetical protein
MTFVSLIAPRLHMKLDCLVVFLHILVFVVF